MKCGKCKAELRVAQEQVGVNAQNYPIMKNFAYCDKCRIKYDYIPTQETPKQFNGIYRYTILGTKKEVHCPRCKSHECSHYQEQRNIKGKAKYTPNLNPLKPFTIVNKKENYKVQTVSRFLCNKCGNIFD